MKQRLGIAAALLQPRTLLVLDEPTNGLDPQGTREVRTLVRELAADGTTVLLSSHLLAEIEQVCSHIGIMSRGRLLRQGPLDQLGSADTATVTVTTTPDGVSGAARVLNRLQLLDVQTHNRGATALLGDTAPEDITVALVAAAVRVQGLAVSRPSLEDLFVQLTGEGFDVAR
jgi:ABC-type multidrug transport system ATPase subunit